MRRVVASENLSLDGVMENPERWAFSYQTDDMAEFLSEGLNKSNALMFGRVTYEKFAAFWPTSDIEPFASKMNNSPKYVASTTLKAAPWGANGSATILNGNITDEIIKLKQQDDIDIVILGSGKLVTTLLEAQLLDELQLFVHPVILGAGKRLFDGETNAGLKLVESRAFSGGVVMVTYQPA